MSLQNLLTIGQLESHETNAVQVRRMLESAKRSIADAKHQSISPETRLDVAYRAITQLSMVSLWANGFRPAKSRPGHHQTMIQSCEDSGFAAAIENRVRKNAFLAGFYTRY